jgi:hypothetical protein
MSLLTGIGAVNALLRGATGLVKEIKRPRLSNDDFANILKQKIDQPQWTQGPSSRLQIISDEVTRMTDQLIATRDIDGSRTLNMQESGLSEQSFQGLDANRDGELSHSELRASFVQFLDAKSGHSLCGEA